MLVIFKDVERATEILRKLNLSQIAGGLGIAKQAVAGWRRISADRVRQVSDLTGLEPWELRPDLFDAPATVGKS